MIIYNFICVIMNLFIFILFCFSFFGENILDTNHTDSYYLHLSYKLYFYSKVFELLDTVWMVLKGNYRLITGLHLWHHASMLVMCDIARERFVWFGIALPMLINSFIHIPMYSYVMSLFFFNFFFKSMV